VIELQRLTPEDWRVIRDVRLRSLADAPQAFTSSVERESQFDEETWRDRTTTCQWFVANDHGEIVGVAGGLDGWSGEPSKLELVGMWVAPSHRGQGIARRLLHCVALWARSEGATTLSLGVREGNEAAHLAYDSMGLRSTGQTMPVWNVPTESIEIMEMDLASTLS